MSVWSEIHEQPDGLVRFIQSNQERISDWAPTVADINHIVIAARGTSNNAAHYAQYVWGARNHLSVALAAPSLYGVYHSPPSLAGALVVGISQSGESPDLLEVIQEAKRQKRPTLAITNHPDSPMAELADVTIELSAGVELAVAATKTYTMQLAAVAAISLGLSGEDLSALEAIEPAIRSVLSRPNPYESAVRPLTEADRCIVLGRGFHLATAFEWALKLQELSYLVAQPFSLAVFMHGPIAAVDEEVPVLMAAFEGPMLEAHHDLAIQLRERSVRLAAITDVADFPADETIVVPAVEGWLAPMVAAPALQIFSHHTAEARGLDPESPRGLSKVTRTH